MPPLQRVHRVRPEAARRRPGFRHHRPAQDERSRHVRSASESWWQQFTGRSIVGEHAGARLARVPSSIVSFDAFRLAFPDGQVLGRNTGHSRPYGRNPYYGYDRIDQHPFLLGQPADGRLPPMERVLSVTLGGQSRIYPFRELSAQPVVNDRLNGTGFVVFAVGRLLSVLDDESIRESKALVEATAWKNTTSSYPEELTFSLVGSEIRDDQTDSVWNVLGEAVDGRLRGSRLEPLDSGVHFAFAWLAFNPETDIHSSGESD
ncbi:MAG: DUF3179 domain-containing protein [Gammaproteobacteria bacterium]|nr:DUF3179 domain-containing protein [Gammaproteobacteria bacterium]MYD75021.1 DUF3179 domain-containing protein [Gammaproteobacteria bacterium]MYJ51949.1 DUF3179 domain-containing protein [Gammaproteobacteria bacterium]